MDKLKKKILFIFLISIILCSVQAIAAAEVDDAGLDDEVFDLSNDIETVEADNTDELIQVTDEAVDDEVLAAPESEDALSEGEGNFTELQTRINSPGNSITLDKDYKFSNGDSYLGIRINKDFTINGNGHTINGTDVARLFNLGESASGRTHTIILKDLNLVNAYIEGNGGAINLNSNIKLILENCNFTNNSASRGAAIYSSSPTTPVITITQSNFKENKVVESGGAIYAWAMNISDSVFESNSAGRNGGVIYRAGGTTNIDNCTFESNRAGRNGGVFVSSNAGNVYVNNSRFIGNNASNGGAFHISNQNLNLVFNNTNITDNVATNNGGAICRNNTGLILFNSRLIGNNATRGSALYLDRPSNDGGYKIVDLIDTVVLENQANSTKLDVNTSGNLETGENVKINITFTGEDNLYNGIYRSRNVPLNDYFNDVTYWNENGEASTGLYVNHPDTKFEEAGINITLNITDSKGNCVLYNKSTDANGQITFVWDDVIYELGLKPGVYTVTPIHIEDNYYTGIKADPITIPVPGQLEVLVSDESVSGKVGETISVEFEVNETDGTPVNGGHSLVHLIRNWT